MKRIRNKRHRDAEYFSQMYENVNRSEVFATPRSRRLYFAWCAPILKAEGCYWSKRIVDLLTRLKPPPQPIHVGSGLTGDDAMKIPSEGDTAYEVEWYPICPGNQKIAEDDDTHLGEMECSFRIFPNKGLAMAHAKRVAPSSMFASAMVRPVTYTRFGQWENDDVPPIEVCA